MEGNIFVQEYFNFILYLYHTLNILLALLGLIRGNLMEGQKKILKI